MRRSEEEVGAEEEEVEEERRGGAHSFPESRHESKVHRAAKQQPSSKESEGARRGRGNENRGPEGWRQYEHVQTPKVEAPKQRAIATSAST
jgi:hypothetical protein